MSDQHLERNIDTLILPGLRGSPDGHWQRHWLVDRPGARIVEQENWEYPNLGNWISALEAALLQHDELFIVAHSLGCLLAAKLASSSLAHRVKGALLVAPCDLTKVEMLHPGIVDFGEMPVVRLPFPSLVVASLDDPYMDFETTRRFAGLWGSELADLGHAGHINIDSGYGRWPLAYQLLDLVKHRATNRPQRVRLSIVRKPEQTRPFYSRYS